MSVCDHSVFLLGSGFLTGCSPVQEIISLTRTMALLVRTPFKAWMSACVHSVFVLGSGFAMADPPFKKGFRSLKERDCVSNPFQCMEVCVGSFCICVR
jgi:hypothetical protein